MQLERIPRPKFTWNGRNVRNGPRNPGSRLRDPEYWIQNPSQIGNLHIRRVKIAANAYPTLIAFLAQGPVQMRRFGCIDMGRVGEEPIPMECGLEPSL